jgi:hypothetical protein
MKLAVKLVERVHTTNVFFTCENDSGSHTGNKMAKRKKKDYFYFMFT